MPPLLSPESMPPDTTLDYNLTRSEIGSALASTAATARLSPAPSPTQHTITMYSATGHGQIHWQRRKRPSHP